MLRELAIKNFAIIDDIRISFSGGLCILTGETGAGKSIIIEAVNLLLGGRASADLVRTGEKHAELEASFIIAAESAPAVIMKENGFNPSDGLTIRRIISYSGRHKIFINSRQSTIQMLKLVTENLASISSQHAHQGLLNEENHLDILDTFAGTWPERRKINHIYNELAPLIKEIESLKSNIDRIAEENDFLKFQINEIEQADIKPHEDEILETEKNRLKNGAQIYEVIQSGINELYAKDGSILEKLGLIRSDLEKYGSVDRNLAKGAEILSKMTLDLEDLTDGLRRISDNIDLDPDILEKIRSRLDLVRKLKRKYSGTGGTLDDLFRRYHKLKEKISDTENITERIEEMQKRAFSLAKRIREQSIALSKKRSESAAKLAHLAENELRALEMDNTRFEIILNKTNAVTESFTFPDALLSSPDTILPEQEINIACTPEQHSDLLTVNGMKIYPTGIDRVSFLMAPNPGEPAKPLNRIASGGELSRVVLALKAVLSENEPQGTLVFDEVDSGIGGRTSDKVGIKLKRLSEKYQVLCITHLAQIAKYGTDHYKIEKQVINNRTSTSISLLSDHEARIKELARVMGGTSISQATLDHAAEMLITNTGIV